MLTTAPFASPQVRPILPGSPPLPHKLRACPGRKRGAQPGNSNAFRHGLYCAQATHTRAALFQLSLISQESSALPSAAKLDWIASLNRMMVENRRQLLEIAAITAGRLPFAERTYWLRAVTRIMGTHLKATRALHELGGRQAHVHSLVRDLPALLNRGFERRGIPEQPVFVPQELENFHANLVWESPELLAWIAKSRQKQGQNPLEIARAGLGGRDLPIPPGLVSIQSPHLIFAASPLRGPPPSVPSARDDHPAHLAPKVLRIEPRSRDILPVPFRNFIPAGEERHTCTCCTPVLAGGAGE